MLFARISVQWQVEEEDEAAASSNNEEDEIFDPTEDMIESVFGFFFGKKEEEPMGMKRFWKERFPKQYEGMTDAKKYGVEFRPLSFHRYHPKVIISHILHSEILMSHCFRSHNGQTIWNL